MYSLFEKLKDASSVDPEVAKLLEESISQIPARHRELAESVISSIEITDSNKGNSFVRSTGLMRISRNTDKRMVIHEYAHALELALGSYNDANFRSLMFKGLEGIGINDVIYDDTTFVEPIFRIENAKFVSPYQGRLYEEYGIFNGTDLSLDGMRDYLAEGYAEYITNPENLKNHDPDLFNYFEGIT